MSYRGRGYRDGSRREDGYLRNLRYEAPKEGLGKLAERLSEWAGAAVGLVAATAIARQGVSVPPTVLAGSGLALGAVSGAAAKATVAAAFDTVKERRRQPRANRTASTGTVAGSVSSEIEKIICMIDKNHQALIGVIDRIGTNHAWLLTTLAGASPSLLQQVNGQLADARRAVEEACTLLRLSNDKIRSYLRLV
uniref:Uncharacterized protein n=1 Tax=Salinispora arenicola (strain CNS-205) TaxID=391037 RepID=A8LYM1_SALAI